MAFTTERYGRLDVLINVAGVDIDGKIADLEMERWERASPRVFLKKSSASGAVRDTLTRS